MLEAAHSPLGAQDLRFLLAKLRRDVALVPDERLTPHVVVGHGPHLALRHLDPVAEHAVVTDPERPDPGALALPSLEACDPGPRLANLGPHLRQGRAPRLTDQAALVHAQRRLVHQRGLQGLAEAVQVLQRLRALTDQEIRAALHLGPEGRQRQERRAKRGQVPRAGDPERHPAGEARDVADPLERLAKSGQERGRFDQGRDRTEALGDLAGPEQGTE